MLLRKEFKRGEGPFTVDHLYYKDNTRRTIMANSVIAWYVTRNDDRPRISFCVTYYGAERVTLSTVFPKNEMQITMHTPNGYKSVTTLDRQMVSRLGLNPRKTWFGVYSEGSSILDARNRKFSDILGFRRVPRRWVPEMDRMLIKSYKN